MRWTKGFTVMVFLALGSGAARAEVAVSFEGPLVAASGISPRGEAIFFSLVREPQGYISRIERGREVVQANEDGLAVLELPDEVPVRSIWAVVDLASGDLAVAGPEGSPLLGLDLPPGALPADGEGRHDRLVDRREGVDMLVVRPGAGVWSGSFRDGGANDLDGADDGWLSVGVAALTPSPGGPEPPQELLDGDVLVVMDPRSFQIYGTRLAGLAKERTERPRS